MVNASRISIYADISLKCTEGDPTLKVTTPWGPYMISGSSPKSHVKIGEYLLTATSPSGNSIDVFTGEPETPPSEYVRVLISNVLITDDPGIAMIVYVQYKSPTTPDQVNPLPVITSTSNFPIPPQQISSATMLPSNALFQFAFANLIGFSAADDVSGESWQTSIYPNGWEPYGRSKQVAVTIKEVSHDVYAMEETVVELVG